MDRSCDTTKYTYDEYGLITNVEAPTGETRKYIPGIEDSIVNDIPGALEGEIIDPTPYNSLGSKSEKEDALGNTIERYLDANSRVTQEKDPLGRTTKYEYTGRGYISKITYPNGAITEFTYDTKGNMLTKKVSGEGGLVMTTTYTYDATFSKPTTLTDPNGNVTTLKNRMKTIHFFGIQFFLIQQCYSFEPM